MLTALHTRRDSAREEEGFTLIELMVVVLIIAILIAIAIPTFLGARSRAQDRAAQSNLRNALAAQKSYFTDRESYSSATASMEEIEPSLTYAAGGAPTAGVVHIVLEDSGDTVVMGTRSESGTCFYIKDVTGTTGAGTFYSLDSDGTCAAPSGAAVTGTEW
jgi:type IV pilus assembly protein PilA